MGCDSCPRSTALDKEEYSYWALRLGGKTPQDFSICSHPRGITLCSRYSAIFSCSYSISSSFKTLFNLGSGSQCPSSSWQSWCGRVCFSLVHHRGYSLFILCIFLVGQFALYTSVVQIYFLFFPLSHWRDRWTGDNILLSWSCFQVWSVQCVHAKSSQFFLWLLYLPDRGDVLVYSNLSATLFSHDPTKKEGYWWKSQTAITWGSNRPVERREELKSRYVC